jgi:hypothetical protein
MTETKLLELLKTVWHREMSADDAMDELLSHGAQRYGRDVTNKAFVCGIELYVDFADDLEYTRGL